MDKTKHGEIFKKTFEFSLRFSRNSRFNESPRDLWQNVEPNNIIRNSTCMQCGNLMLKKFGDLWQHWLAI